jgi:dTDP-4-dehydrorhamnose 3,5-epimerase
MSLPKIPTISKLKRIINTQGDIFKFIDKSSPTFIKFGEVYCSEVNRNAIKAWKLNKLSTSNIIVPRGKVIFVVLNPLTKRTNSFILGDKSYYKLTIPPLVWYGFMGIDKNSSLIINLIDMIHNSSEQLKEQSNFIKFNWDKFKI